MRCFAVTLRDLREDVVRSVDHSLGETWRTLREGISVGHKRIQKFAATEVSAVRLVVKDCVANPLIRKLAVHHAG